MKQVLVSQGEAVVREVPAPTVGQGEVLVKVSASCLSVGTEMSGVRASGVPLWRRALYRPEQVAKAARMALDKGVRRTWEFVEQKRSEARQTGYSAAGVVVETGSDVSGLAVGDRVACAGGGYAVHAEYIRVPRNLCVPVPDGVGFDAASTVTLGAIALQGVRRASPTLGETFVVAGLGILGQMTVQLLRANGCRVIGVDPAPERIDLAREFGMELGIDPSVETELEHVARLTDGLGADGVIITAATMSDAVVSQAFQVCRKKGRVVLVGDVGLTLNRRDFYEKEIDFLISTSYGPGRYDYRYEELGYDYPPAYVRWTENRNMAEYLRQIEDGRVDVGSMITARHPVDDAPAAYASLSTDGQKPLMVLLTYPEHESAPVRSIRVASKSTPSPGTIRVAVVGAGAFAQANHLPNLKSLGDRFELRTVVSRSGPTATAAAKRFGAVTASTDFDEMLEDRDIDAIIVATRHNLHASMALAALQAGKHVLVEKPTALTKEDLESLDEYLTNSDETPMLMTGYNRRFSPYGVGLGSLLRGRSGPFIVNYRMNAGFIPADHWVHGPEGGGRNLGEACHIYDLFTFLANTEVASVSATSIAPASEHYRRNDNFIATIRFTDGSVASLTYSAAGSTEYAKETADLYVDGKTAILHDYERLEVYGGDGDVKTAMRDKGFRDELVAFADCINNGKWPIPWWQQKQVVEIGLEIERQLTNAPK